MTPFISLSQGSLLDRKPKNVAAMIKHLYKHLPDQKKPFVKDELHKLIVEWPTKTVKTQKKYGRKSGLITNILIIAEDIQVDPQACSRWALTRSIEDWNVLPPGGKVLPPVVRMPPRRLGMLACFRCGVVEIFSGNKGRWQQRRGRHRRGVIKDDLTLVDVDGGIVDT